MAEIDEDYDSDEEFEKSKSQVKRELSAVRDMGKQLVELPIKELAKLTLPDNIYDVVIRTRDLSHGALKRELGYLGKILMEEDHEAIKLGLVKLKQVHQGEVQQFHQLEQWRDGLIAGEAGLLNSLYGEFPDFDGQYVRQLVRNAKKEASQSKPPKSSRLLFQYLQELSQVD